MPLRSLRDRPDYKYYHCHGKDEGELGKLDTVRGKAS